MQPEVPNPAAPEPDGDEPPLTSEEKERAKTMFDSMGMDGEHVSIAETREMLSREAAL